MKNMAIAGDPLDLGAKVPEVKAKGDDGQVVDFAAEGAEGKLLVYFFPKADTPGCTKQGCSLRDADAELKAAGIAHDFELFPDGHPDVQYRNDVSLPRLGRAIGAEPASRA